MKYQVINLSTKGSDGHISTMDCYLPEVRGSATKKSILILPGGGYGYTSDREGEPVALEFVAKGYNAFVLWYSVAPNRFPIQLNQVHEAMQHIKKEFQSDSLFICGFSAGGHLAGSYLTEKKIKTVSVVGGIMCYPVVTSDEKFSHIGSLRALLGEQYEEEKDVLSIEKRVDKKTPPMFIWHTAQDGCVPVKNALVLANALEENGVPFELHIYTDGDHGLSVADERVCEMKTRHSGWIQCAIDWANALAK